MLKMTPELKKHLTEKLGLAGDATDEVALALAEKCMEDGTFSFKDYKSLTNAPAASGENRVKALIGEAFGSFKSELLGEVKNLLIGGDGNGTPAAAAVANPPAGGAATIPAGQVPADPRKAFGLSGSNPAGSDGGSTPDGYDSIRVKSIIENFSDNRVTATWAKSQNPKLSMSAMAGESITVGEGPGQRTLDMPTDRSKAIAGAWFKLMVNRAYKSSGCQVPSQFKMRELDRKLCEYAVHECKFVGPIGWEPTAKGKDADSNTADYWCEGEKLMSDLHRKTLLDDSTSGGLEAVPIEFDAAVILTPLLTGELFPFVSITNVTRRRIEAAAVGEPDMYWGTNEGTAIGLFNTDAFISAFDNTIYPITGAMELGRDFLADSPLDIGAIVVERYGKKFLQAMDNVIATGDGTTQPEGLFTAAGVGSAGTPAGGAGAAPQIGDYEALQFGIGKEYLDEAGRGPNSRAMYIGTQTSYRRARGIAVDAASPSTDSRRLFGMDEQTYRVFDYRYAINSTLTNAQVGFFCMNRYRMYRRQGLEVRIVRDDSHSVRTNTETIVLRARFGGALEQGAAGVKFTNMQA